ncbi:DUF86 domain-containing protein [Limnothrix sp. PR1529]|uniref:HepT-like ribonuclease domain-containing protein n=1 Tax=Limnothrix sp. PR1529 TaxID=1704291 RepID=UPI000B176934|nr:HepT-like ribonuclease domain-containing protein [Limnothrix sp. PR1529]
MLNAAQLAQSFVQGIDWEVFEQDLMRQAAVIRQLEIIGEAARGISTETQAAIPSIPWAKVIGMRNRLIHEYDAIDLEVALPGLITAVEQAIT